jgi:hypothetical protein
MIENTILCVKWGTKYDDYVEKLKSQIEKNCSVPFNFYCITDNPTKEYDILCPNFWDKYYEIDPFGYQSRFDIWTDFLNTLFKLN